MVNQFHRTSNYMDFVHIPFTKCERSAYDNIWRGIIASVVADGSGTELISLLDVDSFLRSRGFHDERVLHEVYGLLIRSCDSAFSANACPNDGSIRDIPRSKFYALMRALSITQRSQLREVTISDISDSSKADIPLFRYDSKLYRPSSACERSAYESLWRRVNESRTSSIEGGRVVMFASQSGIPKDTLSKCWCISLNETGRHVMEKDEFFIFLRCISFVQTTGIMAITKEHITSTVDQDLPLPDFTTDEIRAKSILTTDFPSAFYFPQSRLEIQAYDDLWRRAQDIRSSSSPKDTADSAATNDHLDSIGAVDAISFIVTSRLQRSILKVVWAICSPSAAPVKETRLSREQFNVLLRGVSLLQQFPSQPLTAESITRSSILDLQLPCFDFTGDDLRDFIRSSPSKGPRPPPPPAPPVIPHQQVESKSVQSKSRSPSLSADSPAILIDVNNSMSTMSGSPARWPAGKSLEDLMNADTQSSSSTQNKSLASSDGSRSMSVGFAPSMSAGTSSAFTADTAHRTISTGLVPESSTRAGSIGPNLLNMDYASDADSLPHASDDGTVGKAASSSHAIIPVAPPLGSEQAEPLSKMCVCGDMVERFKQDCVRLRCKCMIHTHCLAQYIKSQLEDSTRISGDGIRCCYWHMCRSHISMDDVDKFSAFIGKVKVPSPTPTGTALRQSQSPSEITNFGSDEVDKFTRFAVAASFNDGDLVYCPSCSTPFWIDEKFKTQRVVCLNPKCGLHFCRSCQIPWHIGYDCDTYQMSVAGNDKLSYRYVAATSKKCPSCSAPFTHYHGHSCHHISPVGSKGGGCPSCHVHFCYACLSTAEENIALRGDRKSCRCAKGKWGTFCETTDITRYLIQDPYPHDSRCGCPICPDCRFRKPCGGLGHSGSSCDGSCVVCLGLVPPGPLEIASRSNI